MVLVCGLERRFELYCSVWNSAILHPAFDAQNQYSVDILHSNQQLLKYNIAILILVWDMVYIIK